MNAVKGAYAWWRRLLGKRASAGPFVDLSDFSPGEWAVTTTAVVEKAPEAVRIGQAIGSSDGKALGMAMSDAEAGETVVVRASGDNRAGGFLFFAQSASMAYVASGKLFGALPEFTRFVPRELPRAQRTEDLNVERGIRLEGGE